MKNKKSLKGYTLRLGILTSTLILLVLTGIPLFSQTGGDKKVTFKQASEIVTKNILNRKTKGLRVYGLDKVLAKGKNIAGWRGKIMTPYDGYLFFIDQHPLANWEHDCTWVVVSTDGKVTNYKRSTPPQSEYFAPMNELTDSRLYKDTTDKKILRAIKDRQQKMFSAPIQRKNVVGNCYALLVSGGYNPWNNHIRYWGDIAFIYRTLIYYYNYNKSDIVVCMSDGDNPALDRSDSSSSPTDLDGDGVADYSKDATYNTVTAELQNLVNKVGPNDQVFIFTTNHGGNPDNTKKEVYLWLWNQEILHDYEFADYINQLPASSVKIICMEQCFSGGFVDNIQDKGTSNVVMSTACGYWESSWAGDTYPEFDEFVYEWTSAVNWAKDDIYPPPPTSVDADSDNNGTCEIDEAHQWAVAHDDASESPQWLDSSSTGGDTSLCCPEDGGIVELKRWSLSFHGGYTLPVGGYSNLYKGSYMLGFDFDYHFTQLWSVVGFVGYNHFKNKWEDLPDTHWWNLSGNLKYEFNTNPIRPYVNLGGGIYIPKTGSAEPGVNVGAGVDYSINPGLVFACGSDYHHIFSGGNGISFYTFHIGLIYRF